jgi:Bifunctional DNA primase/polymerase, N-terminal
VVPGTYLGADRRWHGRQDATGLRPISDTWRDTSITDPEYAHEIWSQHPYGVLLVCGLGVDVLELPSSMLGVLSALQSATPVIPVAITGSPPQFLVFTATDPGTVLPDLQEVHRHGAGSWIALPPTATELVLMQRWWTMPAEGELPLLPTQVVLDALRSAGPGGMRNAGTGPPASCSLPVVPVGGRGDRHGGPPHHRRPARALLVPRAAGSAAGTLSPAPGGAVTGPTTVPSIHHPPGSVRREKPGGPIRLPPAVGPPGRLVRAGAGHVRG